MAIKARISKAKLRQILFFQLIAALLVLGVACNAKSDDTEEEIAVTPALVAVKNFYLKANDSVMENLDSVSFSIDLNTGVIFNADSLPKGTDVSRLLASITFANTMTKAELTFLKDGEEETTVDYLTNPEDSIDFTYPVALNVTAEDGLNSFTYQIRVNVHKAEPDTLIWAELSTSKLPSRYEAPVAQKTIIRDDVAYCLIEEYNGEYTLSSCTELNEGEWTKGVFEGGFAPDVESFTATPERLWLLSSEGEVYSSAEGVIWTNEGQTWTSILGGYGESILGVKYEGGGYVHAQYPEAEGFIGGPVEDGFPIYKASALGLVDTEWYPEPTAILACGVTDSGALSSAVWAYDGEGWAEINTTSLPALESPMMTRYVVYRDTPYIFLKREFDVWLLFGGTTEDGDVNTTVYMSYDNGVNWQIAPEMMQLPETMTGLKGSDVIVAGYELSADLSEAWTPQENTKATRTAYTIEGYDITWICPYLYVFGGYSEGGELSTEIWRGVLARLEFTPI